MITISSCSTRPSNVLGRDKMYDVHRDIKIMESYLNASYNIPDSTKLLYYESVFSKHNITRSQYDSSLVWYGKNIHLFSPVLDKLADELDKESSLFSTLVKDSIYKEERKHPKVEDLIFSQSRKFAFSFDDNVFLQTIELKHFPEFTAKDTLCLAFRARIAHGEWKNRLDSLFVNIYVHSSSSYHYSYSEENPDGVLVYKIPCDTIFNRPSSVLLSFFWIDKTHQHFPKKSYFLSYIDSLRLSTITE